MRSWRRWTPSVVHPASRNGDKATTVRRRLRRVFFMGGEWNSGRLLPLRGAVAGEDVAESGFGRGDSLYLRHVGVNIRVGDRQFADKRLSEKRGEQLEGLGRGLKYDVAQFVVRPGAAGDFVDPLSIVLEVKHAHPTG